jgi:hypothetical protein
MTTMQPMIQYRTFRPHLTTAKPTAWPSAQPPPMVQDTHPMVLWSWE